MSQSKLEEASAVARCDSLFVAINGVTGYSEAELDLSMRRFNILIEKRCVKNLLLDIGTGYVAYNNEELVLDFSLDSIPFIDSVKLYSVYHLKINAIRNLMNEMLKEGIVTIKTDPYGDCTGHAVFCKTGSGALYYCLHSHSHCYEDELELWKSVRGFKEVRPNVFLIKKRKSKIYYNSRF